MGAKEESKEKIKIRKLGKARVKGNIGSKERKQEGIS